MKKKYPGARRRQACSLMSCAVRPAYDQQGTPHGAQLSKSTNATRSRKCLCDPVVGQSCSHLQELPRHLKPLGEDASQASILFLPYYECICIARQKGEARAKGETGDIFLHTGSLFSGEKHSQGQRRLREDSFLCEVGHKDYKEQICRTFCRALLKDLKKATKEKQRLLKSSDKER